MQTRRSRLPMSVLLLFCVLVGFAAQAEDYPTRSVKLITQGAAASGPDVVARIVAEPLGRLWGQQVVILNHPGAGGSVAARQAASAAAAAGLQDLVGGRISMIVESLGPFLGAIQGGSLKALAVASAQRLPNFPDLPTVAETIPGFIATGWFPLLAPAGTPDWIVRK